MGYYDKITRMLENSEDSFAPKAIESFENFADICQQFCQLQSIYEYVKPASHIFPQYRDPEARLTKGIDKKIEESLSLENKLYIELLWKMYCKHFSDRMDKDNEKAFINTFVESSHYEKNLTLFWNSVFAGNDLKDDLSHKYIQCALEDWRMLGSFSIRALNFSGLHDAMKLIHEGTKLPKIAKGESMENLIADNVLNYLLSSVQAGNLANLYLQIAPVRKSITTGKIASSYPDYLKKSYEYNLEKLQTYIEELKMLRGVYDDMMSERKELFAPYI